MNLRKSCLPVGWYPRDSGEISRFLSGFSRGNALAAIAPHAGWSYSGRIAARAVASLDGGTETLAVIGGHLPAGYPPLFAMEDAVSTPLGDMAIDTGLRNALLRETGGQEDSSPDNTVEVLLPMARYFFPKAQLLWLRLPADISSFDAGKALAAAARSLGRTVAVLASADLTHYGLNYGFSPKGSGPEALRWVKEVNDRSFIEAVESGDPAAVIARAQDDQSCCSAGAVAGAMGFASATSAGLPRLLEYATSADVTGTAEIPESFVGYAAFTF